MLIAYQLRDEGELEVKLTAKQMKVLEAARNQQCLAGKASFRSKRDFNVTIDFEAGYFNAQFDRLEELGLVALGRHLDGVWGPRYVNITEAGQKAFKNGFYEVAA
jgi:hypothetical protein